MRNSITKKISAALAVAMSLTMVAVGPKFADKTVNADTNDIKYALSQLNKFATITSGNFTDNNNHTMAPIACGGDFTGSLVFQDQGVGYFGSDGYDIVIKGSAANAGFGLYRDYDYLVAGYETNGFSMDSLQRDYFTKINGNDNDTIKDLGTSAMFNLSADAALPIDFAKIDKGMQEWSKMVDDYCNQEKTPDDVINVKASGSEYTNLDLKGTDSKLNFFNVDMNGSKIVSKLNLNVPTGSKVIINVNGTSFAVQDTTFNGSEVPNGENNNPQSTDLDIIYNGSVIFNCYDATHVEQTRSGNYIAPNAEYSVSSSNTNGFLYVKSFDGSVQFHGKNMSNDFTWVPTDLNPTPTPSPKPTDTPIPTEKPTVEPTSTPVPTEEPTVVPTTTPVPTEEPTVEPTATPVPTEEPTVEPTATPVPTEEPTVEPTATPVPTEEPTVEPTATPVPTEEPTVEPTATPVPTEEPTVEPTATPVPTVEPTATPVPVAPTATPTIKPIGTVVTGIETKENPNVDDTEVKAVDKEVTIQKTDSTLTIKIDGTITNPNGDTTIVIVDAPQFGEVIVNYDGTFTYKPVDDHKADKFTYELNNNGKVDKGTVTINITPDPTPTTPAKSDKDSTIVKTGEEMSMYVVIASVLLVAAASVVAVKVSISKKKDN